MVPARTLNPVWSPDSKWIAYSSRLRSLYHAIFVSNVDTGESKQITDGLADAVWPAWDSSGKYLWFLASTDFGLRSQWLDMTSYDHTPTFGLYFAVLRKTDPSPLLPESDEDKGIANPAQTAADAIATAARPFQYFLIVPDICRSLITRFLQFQTTVFKSRTRLLTAKPAKILQIQLSTAIIVSPPIRVAGR